LVIGEDAIKKITPHMSNSPDIAPVHAFLMDLQDRICSSLEAVDGEATFLEDPLESPSDGLSRPRVIEDGPVLERAGVMFSYTVGEDMPGAATERRPELAGRSYEAVSVSLITHPRNPYAPTSHMNVRCFLATKEGEEPVWWFGGGLDLTPHYGFDEDCVFWHQASREAVGAELYPEMKQACDEYFFLKHRGEPRGIGGVFFDDWNDGTFEEGFELMRSVGEGYLAAYPPILERRKDTPYTDRERDWQLVRRGRYVEFNLLQDRGTLFGLQAGGRVECILASMPSEVRWRYKPTPEPGSPEAALGEHFLVPKDWLSGFD